MSSNKILILFYCLLGCLPLSQAQSDAEKENLKGAVKEVVEYIVVEGESKKLNRKAFFSTKGAIKEEQTYHPEGNRRHVYNYDKDGRLASKQIFDPMNALLEQWDWKYNSKGQSTGRSSQTKTEKGMQLARIFECKYNGKGELESEVEMDSKKNTIGTFKFEYNENGTLKTLTVVVGRVDFFYNDKKQLIETKFYTEDGEYNAQKTFAYDEQGNQSEYAELQVGEEKPYSVEKDVYEYDSQNNWISRTTTYLNGKTRVMSRTIEYYEQ